MLAQPLLMRLLGHAKTGWHRLKPHLYGFLLRLKTRFTPGEVTAIVPFSERMWYHNLPIEGKDGYLFHRDHDVIEQFDGGIVFRRRQLEVWTGALIRRKDWCEKHSSLFRMLIVPEKHVVYAEQLPPYLTISNGRPVCQLRQAAGQRFEAEILYPADVLRAAKSLRPVFYKSDTHWTSYAAFLAYLEIMKSLPPSLRREVGRESDLTWTERFFIGDIGVRYVPERGELAQFAQLPAADSKLVFENRNYGRGAVHVYESARRDLPRCVIFRDSFAAAMMPFLMCSFSRIVAVSSLSCHYDLLEIEKPDLVLFETVERFVASFVLGDEIELPQDHDPVSFEAFTGTKLADLASL